MRAIRGRSKRGHASLGGGTCLGVLEQGPLVPKVRLCAVRELPPSLVALLARSTLREQAPHVSDDYTRGIFPQHTV